MQRVSPWFWLKNVKFSIIFIIGKIRQENMFEDILGRKKVSLDYKIRKLKKLKNHDFSKGVRPGSDAEIFMGRTQYIELST